MDVGGARYGWKQIYPTARLHSGFTIQIPPSERSNSNEDIYKDLHST